MADTEMQRLLLVNHYVNTTCLYRLRANYYRGHTLFRQNS